MLLSWEICFFQVLYTHEEIRKLLSRLHEGNKGDMASGTRLNKATSAFGIIGFVKFLQGLCQLAIIW